MKLIKPSRDTTEVTGQHNPTYPRNLLLNSQMGTHNYLLIMIMTSILLFKLCSTSIFPTVKICEQGDTKANMLCLRGPPCECQPDVRLIQMCICKVSKTIRVPYESAPIGRLKQYNSTL